jgi:hypothetical protein
MGKEMKAAQIAGGLFKWIVIPMAFAVLGYGFIGPHIGRPPTAEVKKIQERLVGSSESDTPVATTPVASSTPERQSDVADPVVTAEVTHVNGRKVKERKRGETTEENVPPVTEENAPPEDRGRTESPTTDSAGDSAADGAPVEPAPEEPATLPDDPGGN